MQSTTILIVDDELDVTRAVARVVASPERRIIQLHDPSEAIEVVERESVDLIITDKDMPQMSGPTLIAALKRTHPDIPCVMLTGTPDLQSALTAINGEQVVRYLTKPYNAEELRETVDAGLTRRATNLAAREAKLAAAEREKLLREVAAVDPGALDVTPGALEAVGSLGDRADDVVRRLAEEDPGAGPALRALRQAIAQARPTQIADAVAAIPVRRGSVGALLVPGGQMTTIAVDVRGRIVELGELPRAQADAVAARLAAMAGLPIGGMSERLGRISVKSNGATGELVVGYRHTPAGSSVELRRLLVGTDDTGKHGVPESIDKYTVLEKLGEGGMGVVHRGLHRGLDRPVAIKILHGVFRTDPIAFGRFLREARTASRSRHPRIVEMLDFGNLPDGRPYLVMELVDAPNLMQRLRGAMFAPHAAVRVAQSIAEGLAAAHAVDVVHRDVKPSNIFVAEDLSVKLADFGAAKLMNASDGLTRDGMILGTPSYMSPEHVMGHDVDGRTDLYGLGCILFQMLNGQVPYRAGNLRALLALHLNAEIPTVSSPMGKLPHALVSLVRSMMAKDAGHRPERAEDVAAQLGHIAATMTPAGS
ncbi:MAG TPA: protein kinase [Kofleriaceae bacterium]|nr:protein kinase [Kofleriaceae bacterium]